MWCGPADRAWTSSCFCISVECWFPIDVFHGMGTFSSFYHHSHNPLHWTSRPLAYSHVYYGEHDSKPRDDMYDVPMVPCLNRLSKSRRLSYPCFASKLGMLFSLPVLVSACLYHNHPLQPRNMHKKSPSASRGSTDCSCC